MLRLTFCLADFNQWKEIKDQNKRYTVEEIVRFLEKNPHYPNDVIVGVAEKTITTKTSPTIIQRLYKRYSPITGKGFFYKCMHVKNISAEEIREGWIKFNFSNAEEIEFLNKFGHLITQADHQKKIDRLLNKKSTIKALQLSSLIKDKKHLKMRVSLIEDKLPYYTSHDLKNPGFVFELIRYYRKHRNYDELYYLIKNHCEHTKDFSFELWPERRFVAKEFIAQKKYKKAFDMVNHHQIEKKHNKELLEALWFKGWLAAEFLHKYDIAKKTFQDLEREAQTPISKARGAYWQAKLSKGDDKVLHLKRTAQYKTTFHGILAKEELNIKTPTLLIKPHINKILDLKPSQKPLLNSNLYKENRLIMDQFFLASVGDFDKNIALLKHISDNYGPYPTIVYTKTLARKFSKSLPYTICYPEIKNLPKDLAALRQSNKSLFAFAHAIARQESEFNQNACSEKAAMGYLQLIESTARMEAKKFGQKITSVKDIYNPTNNLRWGVSQLERLFELYNGNPVLVAAAYNAGPHRVKEWLEVYGDPRKDICPLKWIELIPFGETQNYVMRVMEGWYIYMHMFGEKKIPKMSSALQKI